MSKKLFTLIMCFCVIALLVAACSETPDTTTPAPTAAPAAPADDAADDDAAAPADTPASDFDPSWYESDVIRIGVAVSLTGTQSGPGIDSYRGAQLALEYIMAQGGIHGKPVELIVYDEAGRADEALRVITRLIEQDNIHALFGPLSSNSVMGVGEFVNDSRMPAIGPPVGVVWLAQGWEYYFRATANSFLLVEGLYNMMLEDGIESVAVFYINDEFGINSARDFVALNEQGGEPFNLVADETYRDGDTDFTAQVARIVAADPDAVFMIGWSNDLGPIMRQLRAGGFDGPVYGDNGFTAAPVREVGGEAANNVFLTAAYLLPDTIDCIDTNPAFAGEQINNYLHAYVEKFGELPVSDNTYRSFDGIRIIARAIHDARSLNGTHIRDAIHAISDFEGTIGTMNFAAFPNGEAVDSVSWFQIVDGVIIPRD